MKRYERQETLSIYWANRAGDLRGAAGAVWFAMEDESSSDQGRTMLGMAQDYSFSIGCPFVFFMLCGLSLELLFKALIVEDGEKPPVVHDLRKLASSAHLTMAAEDLELLELLTAHILWAGKYPVPKGGQREWDRHVEHMNSTLTSRVPNMSIPIFHRNDRLSWDDYTRVWNIGHTRYWDLHRQLNP